MKKLKIKPSSSLIFTVAASLGVVATAVVASYSMKNAIDDIKEAEEKKGEKLTKSEIVKTAAVDYIPTVAVSAATIACIGGINHSHRKREAAILSSCAALTNRFKNYRGKVAERYGDEADAQICNDILKSEWLDGSQYDSWPEGVANFYDDFGGRMFQARAADVMQAEYELNRLFILQGFATLYDWYQCLGIPAYDEQECMELGWGDYIGPTEYGYSFIDFQHKKEKIRGNECISIRFPFEPTDDFLE